MEGEAQADARAQGGGDGGAARARGAPLHDGNLAARAVAADARRGGDEIGALPARGGVQQLDGHVRARPLRRVDGEREVRALERERLRLHDGGAARVGGAHADEHVAAEGGDADRRRLALEPLLVARAAPRLKVDAVLVGGGDNLRGGQHKARRPPRLRRRARHERAVRVDPLVVDVDAVARRHQVDVRHVALHRRRVGRAALRQVLRPLDHGEEAEPEVGAVARQRRRVHLPPEALELAQPVEVPAEHLWRRAAVGTPLVRREPAVHGGDADAADLAPAAGGPKVAAVPHEVAAAGVVGDDGDVRVGGAAEEGAEPAAARVVGGARRGAVRRRAQALHRTPSSERATHVRPR